MSEFHFLRPAWFLALAPALVVLAQLWRQRGRAGRWQAIISPALLTHLLLDSDQSVRRLPLLALGLGWLLAVTALAGPTWERQPQPVYRAPVERIVVLDMSPSMAALDLKPDRLTRARYVIRSLLGETREGRMALVVFGAEPHVVTPLTDDAATIEALLPALTTDILPAPGDRGGPALRLAGELLQRVGSARGEILLLSDGVGDPADTLEVLHELRRRDVRTTVLGVGTPAGAPAPTAQGGFETSAEGGIRLARLDESGLRAMAEAGGGRYRRLDEGPVAGLLSQPVDRDPGHARIDRQGMDRWVEKGPWLLLPLLLIAAGAFRRGWLAVLVVLVYPPPPAHAFGWQDLWLRPDQQAASLLEQGNAGAAAERFEHPAWRATASYQAGDYAAAAEGFTGEDADSRYNLGNALARAGRLQEALAAYDQALAGQPGHEDARFNRELIEQLLQSQQQPSGQEAAPDSSQNTSQADAGQQGDTGNSPGEQQGENQDPSQADGNSANPAANDPPANAAAGRNQPPDENHANAEQTTGEQNVPQEQNDQRPGQPDSAGQAHADVAPSVDAATAEQADARAEATETEDGPTGALSDDMQDAPLNEQQLALEQWLRQVPDDPAGLLRRKFMLEHLLRQKRTQSP